MEQRISIVTLGVADLARSREFYERLGWRRSSATSAEIVFFQAGSMALALYPRAELAKDANVAPEGYAFPGFTLAFNARTREEVVAALAEAQKAGATILKPAQELSGEATPDTSPIPTVFCGATLDADGEVTISDAWNPFFAIAENGALQLPD